jgi:hypothetical protein
MKEIIAYALVNKTKAEGLKVFNSQLPIFWIRKVADKAVKNYGGKVIRVLVTVDNDEV